MAGKATAVAEKDRRKKMTRETQMMKAITATLAILVGATWKSGGLRKVVEHVAQEHNLPADDIETGVLVFVRECEVAAQEDVAREEAASAKVKAGSEMTRDAKRGEN
jgi:hypothetical protein